MKEHEICWTWRTHGSDDIRGRETGGTGSTHGTDKMKELEMKEHEMKEHEMGEACSTHEGDEIMNCKMVGHVG
jgi:hypothetical protein